MKIFFNLNKQKLTIYKNKYKYKIKLMILYKKDKYQIIKVSMLENILNFLNIIFFKNNIISN